MEIPVYRFGRRVASATIDDRDAHLAAFHWRLAASGHVVRSVDKRHSQLLHCAVLGITTGIDHKNRNKLDNRRANLRPATMAQNNQNQPAKPNRINAGERTSRFRGVQWHRQNQRWYAFATLHGKRWSAGRGYENELEAALAAQELRTALMPFAEPDPAIAEAIAHK